MPLVKGVGPEAPTQADSPGLTCPGWRGWSCTDNSTAQTLAQQTAATLLLTLSNLLFLAPIAVSLRRSLLVEASVYTYTMFFSTVSLTSSLGGGARGGPGMVTPPTITTGAG